MQICEIIMLKTKCIYKFEVNKYYCKLRVNCIKIVVKRQVKINFYTNCVRSYHLRFTVSSIAKYKKAMDIYNEYVF